jgi:hypothetical protein
LPEQEVGVHMIADAEDLEADPLPHAVACYSLSEAAAALRSGEGVRLPQGAGRFVVSVDGTEPEEDVAALRVRLSPWPQGSLSEKPQFCSKPARVLL